MFYKLIIDEQGNIEVIDRVDHAKKNDGYIYATEKEFALLNKRIVFNYNDEVKDICQSQPVKAYIKDGHYSFKTQVLEFLFKIEIV